MRAERSLALLPQQHGPRDPSRPWPIISDGVHLWESPCTAPAHVGKPMHTSWVCLQVTLMVLGRWYDLANLQYDWTVMFRTNLTNSEASNAWLFPEQ